ncbi:MAG: SWIM zinc finger family protein [Saprospiraceae bacterium]|nr:SWIM zinc finger family protein [Saprospiraceae bacterium]
MRGRKKRRGSSLRGWYQRSSKPAIEAGTGIRGGGKYGATWWGQQWLRSFDQISDSNRLPRGRTYANNGSVRTIQIDGNTIDAQVQGSYLYDIKIEIPLFSSNQQKQIKKIVGDNLDLLARLLNRELPTALDEICATEGIDIFPKSWHTFKASCSCPDWAMPCKHMAAVIYLIANEIDKNPFVVFSLHGYDLPASLEKAGYSVPVSSASKITKFEELQILQSKVRRGLFNSTRTYLMRSTFSVVPECRDDLLAILSERPVFYPSGDFKAVLKKYGRR